MNLPKFKDLIYFENDQYIVISKPANVSSLSERDQTRPSVSDLAEAYLPDLQLCHRLDKETSGAMVLAKHAEAYRHLAIQFEKRRVDKSYHALIEGQKQLDDVEVKLPIAVSARGNVRIDTAEGKPSTTIVSTVRVFKQYTLLECKPITGRMHQIRIHLASMGSPIVSDILYGGAFIYLSQVKRKFHLKQGTEEQPLMSRVALHARRISFQDLDGSQITVEANYAKDMRALLNQLEKHN